MPRSAESGRASSGKPIVVVGSINIDLVATCERLPGIGETVLGSAFHTYPGGKGANQAVAAARLGHTVRMIGRVGDDAFGPQLLAGLHEAGVDVQGVATSPGSSGAAVILVSRGGENRIVVTPGANAALSPADLEGRLALIRSAGIVLTQLEIPLETVAHLARICRREKIPLMLDPAPARELPRKLLEQVDWFTPNESEAAILLGCAGESSCTRTPAAAAAALLQRGVKGVALKLGERGAYLASQSGLARSIRPFAVSAVDSTAAGDAFNGAFATALSAGWGPVRSARFANAAAAVSVTRPGAQPSMPSMAEVRRMLRNGDETG